MNYTDIQTDESLAELAAFIPESNLPKEAISLIKQANLDCEYGDLIKEAFADEENRMFPIYSPEETVLSAIYINNQTKEVPNIVKEACQNSLNEWGIEYIKIEAPLKKTASADVNMEEVMLLPSLGKLPAVDTNMLMKSAAVLSSHFNTLSVAQKVEGSVQLKKFAAKYGVSMTEFDSKFNIYGLDANCDLGKLASDVSARIALSKTREDKDEYQALLGKMAEYKNVCGGMISSDKEINTSIAYELLELDKTAELNSHFDAIRDTFNSVSYETNGGLQKIASEDIREPEDIKIGGYNISLVKIASIPEDIASNILSSFPERIVEDGGINIERLESSIVELPFSAQNEIAQMILQA